MNCNDNGQFNLDWNNRDNQNSDNGPRQKFLVKITTFSGDFYKTDLYQAVAIIDMFTSICVWFK